MLLSMLVWLSILTGVDVYTLETVLWSLFFIVIMTGVMGYGGYQLYKVLKEKKND